MNILALNAGIAAGVGVAWFATEWARLRRTPALSHESKRNGFRGEYLDAGPYRIFSRITGDAGPHVVLVHGLVISSRYMEPLALALSRDFRVHAPDLPGFGESRTRRTALSIRELADALHLWLKASGIERASFVGNSFGCQILTDFAMRYPHAVDRLVLQGPTVDRRARHLLTQVLRDRRNGRLEQARSSAPIGRIDYAKAGPVRAFATMRELIDDRIEDRLLDVEAPTLVVAGTCDPVAPLDWAREVVERLPRGALLAIDGGTHTLNYVYPHSFALAIRPFLRGSQSIDEARRS
ncbi:alpha/beta hydrolase [Paraburkholderia sp. SIMBA_049]